MPLAAFEIMILYSKECLPLHEIIICVGRCIQFYADTRNGLKDSTNYLRQQEERAADPEWLSGWNQRGVHNSLAVFPFKRLMSYVVRPASDGT